MRRSEHGVAIERSFDDFQLPSGKGNNPFSIIMQDCEPLNDIDTSLPVMARMRFASSALSTTYRIAPLFRTAPIYHVAYIDILSTY